MKATKIITRIFLCLIWMAVLFPTLFLAMVIITTFGRWEEIGFILDPLMCLITLLCSMLCAYTVSDWLVVDKDVEYEMEKI